MKLRKPITYNVWKIWGTSAFPFPTRNSYRNPVIAEAMKSLGFVNRFGYGVQRAQALLAQNGNPPAQFDFDEHSVLVKIFRRLP